ncbi:hypothetical protein JDW21_21565 [Bacillus subtilis]|uniref:hypothetical protein n=1 Tax=Bacillales TaxID=1385 RepID=UPI0002FA6128|nr:MULTISPECIES: hypothetical protein [Bacillales]MBW4823336.1 hypothetical protein [Bacillaceae bacterium]QMV48978.1 hypothetical protein Goe12_c00510 [Bacillus phage vB_BsuS-Goe12]QMV49153.1 hypothetical protein Goe13_c00520 [Bacillus phage vB_BsuS-Goe13]AXF33431.1 hypothetical protein DS740_11560 [Bacillus sp. DM2]MBG9786161.1 hypothetical protein [Brevibacillus laterosporus]
MTNEDFKYLNKHLETLSELKKSGYRCDAEIKRVLEAIHLTIFGDKIEPPFKRMKVVFNDVDKSLQEKFHKNAPKVLLVNDSQRGKGKTTLLLRLSQENNIPLLVGGHKEIYKDLAKEKGISCTIFSANYLDGNHFPNGVYIDCTVNKEQLKTIKKLGIEIKGGFHHDEILSSLV